MRRKQPHSDPPVSKINRRGLLQTIGATTVGGATIAAMSGTGAASDCPDPDNGDSYNDCDSASNEFSYYYRPDERGIEGEASLYVGYKGFTYDDCDGCVTYLFDLVGQHEAHGESNTRGDKDYLDTYGFRWSATGDVLADPQPMGSENVDSGETDPDESANASGDAEETFFALGDVLVAGGSVLYPQLSGPAFLYAVARASSVSGDENGDEIIFNDNWSRLKSASFGYRNMRFQVPTDGCGNVEFEVFTDTGNREKTATTKTFNLNAHGGCI